jgi:hypothetical protein
MNDAWDALWTRIWYSATVIVFYVSTLMVGQWSAAVAAAAGAAMSLFPRSTERSGERMNPVLRLLFSGLVGFFISWLVDLWWPGTRVPAAFVSGLLGIPIVAQLETITLADAAEKVLSKFGGGKK